MNTKRKYYYQIATHAEPHPDEYCAELLATSHLGANCFLFAPRIKSWHISEEVVGDITTEYPTTLFLGIGGGQFDDHGRGGSSKSCSRLMAEHLGVDKLPVLIKLLEVIDRHDKGRSQTHDQLTIPKIVNYMHRFGQFRPEDVRNWCVSGLRAILNSEDALLQRIKDRHENVDDEDERVQLVKRDFMKSKRNWLHFNVEAVVKHMDGEKAEEWLATAKEAHLLQQVAFQKAKDVAPEYVTSIDTPRGEIKVLMLNDSEGNHADYGVCFDSASRSLGCDIFVMKNHRGNLIIAANPSFGDNLKDLFTGIRIAEAQKRGISLTMKEASSEGTLDKLPMIHVHEGLGYLRLYNGSTTRTDIEPLLLGCDELMILILDFLSRLSPLDTKAVLRPEYTNQSINPNIFVPGNFEKNGFLQKTPAAWAF